MDIYYVMLEAVPNRTNPEYKISGGAFVNCWVKAVSEKDALFKAKEYIMDVENWLYVKTEDIFIAERERYLEEPESLECYDEACNAGLSAIFYTWPVDSE